jgi:hypothetical protein
MTHLLDVASIVARYGAGESAQSIARSLRVDVTAVTRRLTAAGVALRGAREATVANLARNPSITERMGRPRTLPLNQGYFDARTPSMAYVVGLMQADGSNQVDRGAVMITLKKSDAGHLSTLAAEMGASRPLRRDHSGGVKLEMNSRRLSAGLARWGVVSPKTFTASTHADLLLDRDYWRGVVDGDGTLCNASDGRRILALVGTADLCCQFLAFLRTHGLGSRTTVHPNRSIWTAKVSGTEAERAARVLYADAALALPRKAATASGWSTS